MVVIFSLFRFSGLNKLWALSQMPLQPWLLRREKDLRFFRLMGCGKGAVFSTSPDWSRYAFIAVVPSEEKADHFVKESGFYRSYSKKAAEIWTGFLNPVQSHGAWDGKTPFIPDSKAVDDSPVAVLTRATVNRNRLKTFRKHALPATREAEVSSGLLCSVGMGENPFTRQATFSLWKDTESMKKFAYNSPVHKEIVSKTRKEQWYREDLFARFSLISSAGTWSGKNPVM